MVLVGVAQVLVLGDDYIPVADFLQRAKAQGGDAQLSHSQTAAAATKNRRKKKDYKNGFLLSCCKGNTCDPAVVNLRWSLHKAHTAWFFLE